MHSQHVCYSFFKSLKEQQACIYYGEARLSLRKCMNGLESSEIMQQLRASPNNSKRNTLTSENIKQHHSWCFTFQKVSHQLNCTCRKYSALSFKMTQESSFTCNDVQDQHFKYFKHSLFLSLKERFIWFTLVLKDIKISRCPI